MTTSLILIVLSAWMMIAPDVFEFGETMTGSLSTVAGCLLMLTAVASICISRRWVNFICLLNAVALTASPLWLPEFQVSGAIVNFITGLLILATCLIKNHQLKKSRSHPLFEEVTDIHVSWS